MFDGENLPNHDFRIFPVNKEDLPPLLNAAKILADAIKQAVDRSDNYRAQYGSMAVVNECRRLCLPLKHHDTETHSIIHALALSEMIEFAPDYNIWGPEWEIVKDHWELIEKTVKEWDLTDESATS